MSAKPLAVGKRNAAASQPMLLRINAVVQVTGLGRSTIYRLMAADQFPLPVRLTTKVVAWRRTDLEDWTFARPSAST
jgi:prophage regulatory protein